MDVLCGCIIKICGLYPCKGKYIRTDNGIIYENIPDMLIGICYLALVIY